MGWTMLFVLGVRPVIAWFSALESAVSRSSTMSASQWTTVWGSWEVTETAPRNAGLAPTVRLSTIAGGPLEVTGAGLCNGVYTKLTQLKNKFFYKSDTCQLWSVNSLHFIGEAGDGKPAVYFSNAPPPTDTMKGWEPWFVHPDAGQKAE